MSEKCQVVAHCSGVRTDACCSFPTLQTFRPSRGMNLALCRLLWKLRESRVAGVPRGASAVTSPAHREEPARQGVGSAIDAARSQGRASLSSEGGARGGGPPCLARGSERGTGRRGSSELIDQWVHWPTAAAAVKMRSLTEGQADHGCGPFEMAAGQPEWHPAPRWAVPCRWLR